jgi:hypothetical protein
MNKDYTKKDFKEGYIYRIRGTVFNVIGSYDFEIIGKVVEVTFNNVFVQSRENRSASACLSDFDVTRIPMSHITNVYELVEK